MVDRIKAAAVFVAVCLVIGTGASLGRKAHALDLAWVALVWATMLAATIALTVKAWKQRHQPGEIARLVDRGGAGLLPAAVRHWLFG